MLRAFPHVEDNGNTAGGDTDTLRGGMAKAVTLNSRGMPPDVDRTTGDGVRGDDATMFDAAAHADTPVDDQNLPDIDFLNLIRQAEEQSQLYLNQVNRRAWSQSYRAFHQEHFVGSKYTKSDWRNRSKIFRPKTRSGVRKDMAAVAASLFNNLDAVDCLPGNESDPKQRAAAAVIKALVNYRLDRNSPKVAIPWFHISMGARQDALITGICISKQSWKLELRKKDEPETSLEPHPQTGVYEEVTRDVYTPEIDRPDCQLVPGENVIIDPAAEWTNPIQSASYVILKWPMRLDEIRKKQQSPLQPWHEVDDAVLLSSVENGKFDMSAVRRARESGLDRLDETQTGQDFQIIWVYENFMRVAGEDWTFITVGDKTYLTDPRPVREVYPEQMGDRPLTMGYGALESHRIFPMSPVESWQQYQIELNDLANLTLDAIKQNVMPVTKVVRGRQIDMDQVKRRSSGSAIIVTEKDDVTWERPPDVPQSVPVLTRSLELELDDLAGQFNGSTAQDSNALSRTLGGLKLVSGAANSVQEFDIRIWLQTWCEPTLAQIARLEQYYESDPVVLGLCGEKAQLFQKYGINKIDDELLEQEVTIRVSIGLGAGDPQQRFQKFAMATQLAMPLLAHAQEFQDGTLTVDPIAVMEELYGTAGYRDGGKRFIKKGNPQQNPLQDLQAEEIKSKIDKNKKQGSGSLLTGLAAVAKVALGTHELEAQEADAQLEHARATAAADRQHTLAQNDQLIKAHDQGFQHGHAIVQHQHEAQQPMPSGPEGSPAPPPPKQLAPPQPNPIQMQQPAPAPQPSPPPAGGPQPGGNASLMGLPQGMPPMPQMSTPPAAGRQMIQASMQRDAGGQVQGATVGGRHVIFIRDPDTNRIVGARVVDAAPQPQGAAPPLPPPGV